MRLNNVDNVKSKIFSGKLGNFYQALRLFLNGIKNSTFFNSR